MSIKYEYLLPPVKIKPVNYKKRCTWSGRKGIGKFHVLMRKEKDVWKILMDADTSEGANEETFNKAKPSE